MKKIVLLIAAVVFVSINGFAQNANSGSSQTTNLALSNAIELTLVNGNATSVELEFQTLNQLINGIVSPEQMIKVRSNKKFKVTAASSSNNFNYSGNAIANNILSVTNGLKIMVTSNHTGGYTPLVSFLTSWLGLNTAGTTTLLNNCSAGGNQTFGIKYMATPGATTAPGTYTTDVIFTATQL